MTKRKPGVPKRRSGPPKGWFPGVRPAAEEVAADRALKKRPAAALPQAASPCKRPAVALLPQAAAPLSIDEVNAIIMNNDNYPMSRELWNSYMDILRGDETSSDDDHELYGDDSGCKLKDMTDDE